MLNSALLSLNLPDVYETLERLCWFVSCWWRIRERDWSAAEVVEVGVLAEEKRLRLRGVKLFSSHDKVRREVGSAIFWRISVHASSSSSAPCSSTPSSAAGHSSIGISRLPLGVGPAAHGGRGRTQHAPHLEAEEQGGQMRRDETVGLRRT
jgi:hypothetical protein